MLAHIPPPPPSVPALVQYLQALYRVLTSAFTSVVSSTQGSPRVILTSPNGTLYTVTVDDEGALQVAATPKGGF
jgi:hypothetical protein